MNKKKILSLIPRLPNWLNLILIRINRKPDLIFGRNYSKVYKKFLNNNIQPEFIDFINSILKSSKHYSYRYPHTEIGSVKDFKEKISTITKDDILRSPKQFSTETPGACDACTTGGTSGKPLKILLPKSRYANELGALHALWRSIGYDFSVRAVVRNERLKDKDYIINPITKELIFDGFRSDPEYLDLVFYTMQRYGIQYYHGYTSNAERFANHVLNKGYDYSFLKGIITSSENFYDHQRTTFGKLIGVRHLNFYGHTEKLILGGWCEEGGCYHFYNSYGYPELLDEAGNDVVEVGAIGELVGSTNYNKCMPLLRYRTGDFAVKAPEHCTACGFEGLSAYKILGRWNGERIYNRDESFVSTTALNLHSEIYEFIEGLQYFQPEKGVLEIRVIPSTAYNDKIEQKLLECVKRNLSSDTIVKIFRVADLQKTPNGKYLLLISNVKQASQS